VVASTFANAHRAKDASPFRPEDFMPFMEKQAATQDVSLNVARFKAMFAHKVKKNNG
jgi:hypothetical protein